MNNKTIFALLSLMLMSVGCSTTDVINDARPGDFDGDGWVDAEDNCPALDNPLQENADGDLLGDVCDADVMVVEGDFDGDGVTDSLDNCPALDNPGQENWDGDALGDVCDDDDDNDGFLDAVDNCQFVPNDQSDLDGDLYGDACDTVDSRVCPETVSAHECAGGWVLCEPESIATVTAGHLVKAWDGGPAVYYFGSNGRRYVFPNMKTYHSWFPETGDCQVIRQVSSADLASVSIGGVVTIRPGTFLVKITTDPKVYAITRGGVLHWVESETVVAGIYGSDWRTEIVDVPESFFGDYSIGGSVVTAADYNRYNVYTGTTTIGQDLGLDP